MKNAWEVPEALTQVGIADAIGIKRSEIPRAVNALKKNSYIYEETKHIIGVTRRRKAYFLTSEGIIQATQLKKMLEDTDAPLERAIKAESKRVGLHIRHFFGRKDELGKLQRAMTSKDTAMAVLYGIAGIGKTALATRFIQKRDLTPFWHGCRKFDSLHYVATRIFEHTGNKDKVDVDALMGDRRKLYDEMILAMKEFGGLYVFDDAYKAPHDVMDLFTAIMEDGGGSRSFLTILTARDRMKFYDVRDVKVKHRLVEIELSGLDEESARLVYQRAKGNLDGFDVLNAAVMGHPLALELAAPQGAGSPPMAISDIYTFMNEEISRQLDGTQADFAAFFSLFRGSVESEALTLFEEFDWSLVDALASSGLLLRDPVNPDRLQVHDVLRDFFSKRLFKDRRRKYHSKIAEYYLTQLDNDAVLEGLYHLMMSEDYERFEEEFAKCSEGLTMSGMQMELYFLVEEASKEIKDHAKRAKMLWVREELYNKMGAPDDFFEYLYQCWIINTHYIDVPVKVERTVGHMLPDTSTWNNLTKELTESIEELEKAKDDQGIMDTSTELAWAYWLHGDLVNAQKTLDQLINKYRGPSSAMLLGAKIALEAGDTFKARRFLKNLESNVNVNGNSEANPAQECTIKDLMGCVSFMEGDPLTALAHFEDAHKLASERSLWRMAPYFSLHMLQASKEIQDEGDDAYKDVESGFSRFEDDKGLFYLSFLRCMGAEDEARPLLVSAAERTLDMSGLNSVTLANML